MLKFVGCSNKCFPTLPFRLLHAIFLGCATNPLHAASRSKVFFVVVAFKYWVMHIESYILQPLTPCRDVSKLDTRRRIYTERQTQVNTILGWVCWKMSTYGFLLFLLFLLFQILTYITIANETVHKHCCFIPLLFFSA